MNKRDTILEVLPNIVFGGKGHWWMPDLSIHIGMNLSSWARPAIELTESLSWAEEQGENPFGVRVCRT